MYEFKEKFGELMTEEKILLLLLKSAFLI